MAEDTDAGDEQTGATRVGAVVGSHLPLVLAGVVALTTGLLLLRVSWGNPETALAILQAGGGVSVLMGTALSAAPWVIAGAVGGGLSWLWRVDHRLTRREKLNRLGTAVVVLAVSGIFVSPIYLFASILISVATRKNQKEPEARQVVVLIALSVLWLLVSAKPWWPRESVTVGRATIDGWVVAADGRDLTVLRAEPRRIVHVTIPSASSRRLCSPDQSGLERWLGSESLWSVLRDPSGYPPCDK